MFERAQRLTSGDGDSAFVLPSEWTFIRAGRAFRKKSLEEFSFKVVARLGSDSFVTTLRVSPILVVASRPQDHPTVAVLDVASARFAEKSQQLASTALVRNTQAQWQNAVDYRFLLDVSAENEDETRTQIGEFADARNGMSAGDGARFERFFWEVQRKGRDWEYLQSAPQKTRLFGGMEKIILWEKERGAIAALAESVRHLNHAAQNWRRGKPLWGRSGIIVSQIGANTSIYCGDRFDASCFAIVPNDAKAVPMLVAFAVSGELRAELAKVNPTWKLTSPKTLLQLEIDIEHWNAIAHEQFPEGIPSSWSDDPTQWIFEGRPEKSRSPLQVAVGRLLGYRWPEQSESDDLDRFSDVDGITCIPSVAGEPPGVDRLQQVLATASGEAWTPAKIKELLEQTGSKKKNLADWLRDEFFKQHCAVFGHRPFIWHIWDGQRDGFSALVNYHRFDRKMLEKLTYAYLGQDWVERQRAGVRDELAGAEARLTAAVELQRKLEAILNGENPFDIYVRWKQLHEQPVGWDPDLNDGVRLNIRPFVKAGVLRAPFNINWNKDRGKNPDGSERLNNLHYSLAEKLEAAREQAAHE